VVDFVTCVACTYPYRKDAGGCTNPCCTENPGMSEDRKTQLRQQHAALMREQLEREALARTRARAMNYKRGN
jgi:hypothetical protein